MEIAMILVNSCGTGLMIALFVILFDLWKIYNSK